MTPTPIPILLYHGVDRSAPPALQPWVLSPERFAAHLDLLVDRGCTTLTVSELVDAVRAGRELPERAVALTFDDGLADFAEHAWPALRARDMTATLYVVAGAMGGRADWLDDVDQPPAMLDWDQVRALAAEGCEIGAHSLTHPELDTLRGRALEEEVAVSGRMVEAEIGRPVRSFAYPHGYHDRRVRAAVARAGYDSACAVREALSSGTDDPLALARVTVLDHVTVEELAGVLDGRGLRVAPFREPVRTKAWRAARRVGVRGAVARAERLLRARAA